MSLAQFQVPQERRQGHLGLVQHEMVHIRELFVFGGEERTSCHHFQPGSLAAGDHLWVDFLCTTMALTKA